MLLELLSCLRLIVKDQSPLPAKVSLKNTPPPWSRAAMSEKRKFPVDLTTDKGIINIAIHTSMSSLYVICLNFYCAELLPIRQSAAEKREKTIPSSLSITNPHQQSHLSNNIFVHLKYS